MFDPGLKNTLLKRHPIETNSVLIFSTYGHRHFAGSPANVKSYQLITRVKATHLSEDKPEFRAFNKSFAQDMLIPKSFACLLTPTHGAMHTKHWHNGSCAH